MDITNKTPKEIQQGIFDEIANGVNPEQIRQELSSKGVPTEAYYFTSQAEHQQQINTPADDTHTGTPGWRIVLSMIILAYFVIRIIIKLNK